MEPVTIMLILFFVFLITGVPLAFNMGISSLIYFILTNQDLSTIPSMMFDGTKTIVFLAIPLFMLAGQIMNETGVTDRIIKFANSLVGHYRGGLAQVNVVASMLFAGTSGSALADISGLGSILIPAMEKSGYDRDFSAGVTASSAIQGPIIPPSIPMVIFGAITSVSIGALLIGGLVPGVLIGISDMIVVYFISKKRGFPVNSAKPTLKEIFINFKAAFGAVLMPVIIMGGILTGVFTPTEAAGIGVAYAIFISFILYSSLGKEKAKNILIEVGKLSAVIYMLIATASVFSWILALESIPQILVNIVSNVTTNPYGIMFIINVLLLIWGFWMDTTPAIILLGPILTPLAQSIGVHPVHFGVVMVTNLVIGLITPPYGVALFMTSIVGKISLERLSKAIVPYFLINLIVLGLITYIPDLILFLPRLFGLI
ncbi:MAG: hypothetical protein PWR10_550 [Halanaerobiales bacterium]|nr:hypothetical protein [Halanaerobiales bacterium]